MNTKIVSGVVLSLGFFGSLAAAGQAVAPLSERGKQTFMRVGCYMCHGTTGQNNNDAAKALTPNTLQSETIAYFDRLPITNYQSTNKEVLSDTEIADIVEFLKTVPPPPSADSIDILKNLEPLK